LNTRFRKISPDRAIKTTVTLRPAAGINVELTRRLLKILKNKVLKGCLALFPAASFLAETILGP
jgi:hypothetical protein